MTDLQHLLRLLRQRSMLSVSVVARRLGVARSTVYAWEAQTSWQPPSPAHLKSALDLYTPTPDERLRVWEALGSALQARADASSPPCIPEG